jgi:predicted nucleotidyltransferase
VTSPPLDAAGLLGRLHEAGVEYVVIGGLAVMAHGVQRFTKDLDICPAPDLPNLERLARMLERVDARQLGLGDFDEREFPFDPRRPEELAEGGNFRLLTRDGILDVMQWIPGVSEEQAYRALAADAVEGTAFGVPLKVCSLEQLRRMKRAAGRPQDEQDLADLAAAHPEAGK